MALLDVLGLAKNQALHRTCCRSCRMKFTKQASWTYRMSSRRTRYVSVQKNSTSASASHARFFVISYPRFLTTGWFAPIINMDKVIDISIFMHPLDTNEMLRKFQKKVAEIQSQITSREDKGMVRDPMLDTAYSDLEQLRDSLQQAQERIFDVGLYLTIYGKHA
jgi:hypothetical protein